MSGFVTKIAADGSALDYSTFLGGSGSTFGRALAVDSSGRVVVTGYTDSADFPTTASAYSPTYLGGPFDAFVSRLNPLGSELLQSSFLGGTGADYARALAQDASGVLHLAGETDSPDFSGSGGTGAASMGGGVDAFAVKLSGVTLSPVHAIYVGGSGTDAAFGVAAGPGGTTLLAGGTTSADLPVTAGALATVYSGAEDAFIARVTSSGLIYLPLLW